MPSIRAIPTKYAGVSFRSRAEARWAVFFDSLRVDWEYEPEGYSLPSGPYLPDFFLPSLIEPAFLEVKGERPTDRENTVAQELASATGHRVLIAIRAPKAPSDDNSDTDTMHYFFPGPDRTDDGELMIGWDCQYAFCECARCGSIGIEFQGRSARIGCHCYDPTEDRQHNPESPRLLRAYAAARSARFGT